MSDADFMYRGPHLLISTQYLQLELPGFCKFYRNTVVDTLHACDFLITSNRLSWHLFSTFRLNPVGGNSMHRRWNDGKKNRKKEQRRGGGVQAKKGRILNNSKYSHRVTFALVSQKICCLRRGKVHVYSSLCLDHTQAQVCIKRDESALVQPRCCLHWSYLCASCLSLG